MPGKKITDHQVRKYKQERKTLTQVAAAARAGISERSARRIDETDALPSQREARSWRTRDDPLSELWDGEVVPLLQTDVLLNAVTLLEELQRRHPGQYDTSVLRTLQRRMRQWRALHGAERDVYFAQVHPPGRLGLSDFTIGDEPGVEIGGAAFAHRLYQFALYLHRLGNQRRQSDESRCSSTGPRLKSQLFRTDSVDIAPTEPTVKVKGPPPGSPCPLNLIPQCLVGPPRVELGTNGL